MGKINSLFSDRKHLFYLLWILPPLIPLVVKSPYYLDTLILILVWTVAGEAWNISAGYGGLLSIGHTAYFGIGAYTSALLYMNYGISPWIGLVAGSAMAGIVAFFMGVITLRLKGTFYTLSGIAFANVLAILAVAFPKITNGSVGLIIPFQVGFLNMTWRGKAPYVYLIYIFALGLFILCKYIEKRKFGMSLLALRDNEDAALALGVNTAEVKVKATVLSAMFTAVAGTLYSQYILFVEPLTVFTSNISITIALVAIIGGVSVAGGPILGSIIFVILTTGLRSVFHNVDGLSGLMYGTLLVIIVMFIPNGLIPEIKHFIEVKIEKKYAKKRGEQYE